jgi:heptosyltransferase III
MQRILIITLSNVGDVVMTTPVFEAVYAKYPKCVIDVVADKRSSDILKGAPYLGKIFHREKKSGFGKLIRLIRELRKTYYDLVIDLRTHLIPLVLRGKKNAYKRNRKSLEQHSVEEHYHSVLKLEHFAKIPPHCRLYVEESAKKEAANLMKDLRGDKILAIGPGANWPGKIWPASKFEDLVISLNGFFDGVIQLGSFGEGIPFSNKVKMLNVDLTGRTSLPVLKAVMDYCQLFVGNDSGLGHVAASLGKPSVTVFGVGVPARYKPWGNQARAVLAPSNDLNRLESSAVSDTVKDILQERFE